MNKVLVFEMVVPYQIFHLIDATLQGEAQNVFAWPQDDWEEYFCQGGKPLFKPQIHQNPFATQYDIVQLDIAE